MWLLTDHRAGEGGGTAPRFADDREWPGAPDLVRRPLGTPTGFGHSAQDCDPAQRDRNLGLCARIPSGFGGAVSGRPTGSLQATPDCALLFIVARVFGALHHDHCTAPARASGKG